MQINKNTLLPNFFIKITTHHNPTTNQKIITIVKVICFSLNKTSYKKFYPALLDRGLSIFNF